MAHTYRQIRFKFFELLPLLLLFYISLNGNSIISLNYFSINIHYIMVYYWVLRRPQILGYGFIFLSGIISDVVFGLPLGVNALSLLIIASVAAAVTSKVLTGGEAIFSVLKYKFEDPKELIFYLNYETQLLKYEFCLQKYIDLAIF